MACALASCANVSADVLVAALFIVVVIHSDVALRSCATEGRLLVVDALNVRAGILVEAGALLLGALLPLVADSRACLAAEHGFTHDLAELCACALVN